MILSTLIGVLGDKAVEAAPLLKIVALSLTSYIISVIITYEIGMLMMISTLESC